jgi:hypothetical protein
MESVIGSLGYLCDLLDPYTLFFTTLVVLLPALLLWFRSWSQDTKEPPSLRDVLPFLTNTYQYMTNQTKFIERVR